MKTAKIRHTRLHRIFSMLLAVYFLNFSIDPKDPNSAEVAEDLRINEIESIAELVVEHMLGFSHAFDEHDEEDPDQSFSADIYKFYFCNSFKLLPTSGSGLQRITKHLVANEQIISSVVREISSPPPKA